MLIRLKLRIAALCYTIFERIIVIKIINIKHYFSYEISVGIKQCTIIIGEGVFWCFKDAFTQIKEYIYNFFLSTNVLTTQPTPAKLKTCKKKHVIENKLFNIR